MADIVPVKAEIEPRSTEDYHSFCDLKAQGKTYDEIAIELGYSRDIFKHWAKKSDFDDLVLKARKKYKRADLLKADKCVRVNVDEGNLKAAELIYKREGELVDNQTNVQVNISLTDFIEAEKEFEKQG